MQVSAPRLTLLKRKEGKEGGRAGGRKGGRKERKKERWKGSYYYTKNILQLLLEPDRENKKIQEM